MERTALTPRRTLAALALLAAAAAGALISDHAARSELAARTASLAPALRDWDAKRPRAVAGGSPRPGDARIALAALAARIQPSRAIPIRKIRTGEALSAEEARSVDALRPLFGAAHDALLLDVRSHVPLGPARTADSIPSFFPAMRLATALAVEAERNLDGPPADRARGTALLLDALSLGLELTHAGIPVSTAVGSAVVSAVTAQIERRWEDLDRGALRLGLAALRPAQELDPAELLEAARLLSLTDALRAAEAPASAFEAGYVAGPLAVVPIVRRRVGAGHLRELERGYAAARLALGGAAPDALACLRALDSEGAGLAPPWPDEGLGRLVCRKGAELASARAGLERLQARLHGA